MRKRLIVLLSLTAVFNLLFWLMIANGYSLPGNLVGLSTTAVVGSSAFILLAVLFARVRQPTSPTSNAVFSLWEARFSLVFLPLVLLTVGALVLCFGALPLFFVLGLPATEPIGLVIGSLLGIVTGYIAIVTFFDRVTTLVKAAALPKPFALVASTLQTISLILVLASLVSVLQDLKPFDELQCSKRYLSPSGRSAIVVEDYEVLGDIYYSSAYFDWLIFRKYVGHYPGGGICDERFTTFKWSADERQVDWRTLGEKTLDRQGRWQF